MSLTDDYVHLVLAEISGVLKPIGFQKKGATFKRETPDAVQIINLQRSGSSTSSAVKVTVNLGVALKATLAWLGATREVSSVADCQWTTRIGAYTANKDDKWWSLTDEASAQAAAVEISELLRDKALPELDSMSTEQGVREALKAGLHESNLEISLREYFQRQS